MGFQNGQMAGEKTGNKFVEHCPSRWEKHEAPTIMEGLATAGRNGGDWALCRRQEGAYQYDRGLPCRGRKPKNAEMKKVAARSDEGPAREALERAAGGAYLGAGREKCSMEVMHGKGSQGTWFAERLVEEVEAKALVVRFDVEESLEERLP